MASALCEKELQITVNEAEVCPPEQATIYSVDAAAAFNAIYDGSYGPGPVASALVQGNATNWYSFIPSLSVLPPGLNLQKAGGGINALTLSFQSGGYTAAIYQRSDDCIYGEYTWMGGTPTVPTVPATLNITTTP